MEGLQDIEDVSAYERLEIGHFFEVYKELEPGKGVEGFNWVGRAAAEEEIEECFRRAAAEEPHPT
jgi:inorganic pyrophosphatase